MEHTFKIEKELKIITENIVDCVQNMVTFEVSE